MTRRAGRRWSRWCQRTRGWSRSAGWTGTPRGWSCSPMTATSPTAVARMGKAVGVQKRYLAEVERLPGNAVRRLQQGVELDDGLARAERARVVAGSGRRRMVEVVMAEG